ncbi:MAG: hypothetical protein ACR2MT_10545, partial [Aurantibacter sp.]
MKKLILPGILSILILAACEHETVVEGSETTADQETVISTEFKSYIIDGTKYTIQLDTSTDIPRMVKSEHSEFVEEVLMSPEVVFYLNPGVSDLAVFRNGDEFDTFVKDEGKIESLKSKFASGISVEKGIGESTSKGPVSTSSVPYVKVYKAKYFGSSSFTFQPSQS